MSPDDCINAFVVIQICFIDLDLSHIMHKMQIPRLKSAIIDVYTFLENIWNRESLFYILYSGFLMG